MALRVNLTLNYVTTKKNILGHRDFIDFVYKTFRRQSGILSYLGIGRVYPGITFSSMSPQGWGEKNKDQLPQLSVVAKSVKAALEQAKKYVISVRNSPGLCGFPACFLPEYAQFLMN